MHILVMGWFLVRSVLGKSTGTKHSRYKVGLSVQELLLGDFKIKRV